MKLGPFTSNLNEVAERIIWFEPPDVALQDPVRFVAYAMTYATFEDMQLIRQEVDDDGMRHVLANAPPGIIDPRSWSYWHLKLGTYPAPPMPERNLENASIPTDV